MKSKDWNSKKSLSYHARPSFFWYDNDIDLKACFLVTRVNCNRRMDLTTIKKQIEMGMIRTTERFQRDMMLMFTNALMYNNSDQDIYHMAMEMYKDVMVHIEVQILSQFWK